MTEQASNPALDEWAGALCRAAPELPESGQALAASGLMLGFVLWLTGARVLKTCVAMGGLLGGSVLGYLLLPGAGIDESFGYEAPYVGLAGGAVVGLIAAIAVYRFAMVIAGVLSFGAAGVLVAALYLQHAPALHGLEPADEQREERVDGGLDEGGTLEEPLDGGPIETGPLFDIETAPILGPLRSEAVPLDELMEEPARVLAMDQPEDESAAWDVVGDVLEGDSDEAQDAAAENTDDDAASLEEARRAARARAEAILEASAERVRLFLADAREATRGFWENLEPQKRQTLGMGALVGAAIGLLVGLLKPGKSAAMLTSLVGSALTVVCGAWLGASLGVPIERLGTLGVTGWATVWLVMTLIGWIVQLSRSLNGSAHDS